MTSQKLFATANGRLFNINATNRQTGKVENLACRLSEAACRAFEPSRGQKQVYKYFRVTFYSPQPTATK